MFIVMIPGGRIAVADIYGGGGTAVAVEDENG